MSSDMPMRLQRLIILDELSEIESHGIAIHIERHGANGSLADLRICKERDQIPANVSHALIVGLAEVDDDSPNDLIVGFGQMMRTQEEDSNLDAGRFDVSFERLAALTVTVHQVYRDSGNSWGQSEGMVRFVIGDVISELKAKERMYQSSFSEYHCGLPSGIYLISP